jgi:hypothetical protein
VTYLKTGNRISLLPIAQFCGKAAALSEAHGAGRPAAMSTAFHALKADPGSDDTRRKLLSLTQEERNEISLWPTPTDVILSSGTLRYADMDKECPVGLDTQGEYVSEGPCLTSGTLDMGRVLGDTAYIGDIKKTQWTVPTPDTLQLLAYGWAYAKKNGVHKFTVGLWIAEDGEWIWSDKIVDMTSFEGMELWETIKHAASQTDGQANTGPHCRSCYGRLHCAEHLAPADLAETWLAPIAGQTILDPEKLVAMLLVAERVSDLIDQVKEHAKEAAKRGIVLKHPVTGQVFKPGLCKGRESLNLPKLLTEYPDATKFIERGNPYFRTTWRKP